jgi:hypothetical protein
LRFEILEAPPGTPPGAPPGASGGASGSASRDASGGASGGASGSASRGACGGRLWGELFDCRQLSFHNAGAKCSMKQNCATHSVAILARGISAYRRSWFKIAFVCVVAENTVAFHFLCLCALPCRSGSVRHLFVLNDTSPKLRCALNIARQIDPHRRNQTRICCPSALVATKLVERRPRNCEARLFRFAGLCYLIKRNSRTCFCFSAMLPPAQKEQDSFWSAVFVFQLNAEFCG